MLFRVNNSSFPPELGTSPSSGTLRSQRQKSRRCYHPKHHLTRFYFHQSSYGQYRGQQSQYTADVHLKVESTSVHATGKSQSPRDFIRSVRTVSRIRHHQSSVFWILSIWAFVCCALHYLSRSGSNRKLRQEALQDLVLPSASKQHFYYSLSFLALSRPRRSFDTLLTQGMTIFMSSLYADGFSRFGFLNVMAVNNISRTIFRKSTLILRSGLIIFRSKVVL
ncbi:uncharacterized protein EV420DRAFT_243419 [Desarmillaria tabescens]|uniref:Uncharacterized protein n=1 Tax=Armillaria tabescens TaxID=1929756 RepID=A0AA39N755_ARMTA|nr:uncharacterized protein EV420DRAFT_243419 [Desarmillaria tabescens]KAK0459964.1 hypothetical protein EV420DRAFT_243419 [Desarmillaria tabescens]